MPSFVDAILDAFRGHDWPCVPRKRRAAQSAKIVVRKHDLDFTEVCEIFGGGIFPEEFRGNLKNLTFKYPWIDSESCEAELSTISDDSEGAASSRTEAVRRLFLKAIWQALSGNYVCAIDFISQFISVASDLVHLSKRWLLRAHGYRLLFRSWYEYPPHFRFCDLSFCPSRVTCGKDTVQEEMERRNVNDSDAVIELKEHGEGLDWAELQLFMAISFFPTVVQLIRIKGTFGAVNEEQNDVDDGNHENDENEPDPEMQINLFFLFLEQAQASFDTAGLTTASAYVHRLMYEFIRLTGGSLELQYLDQLKSKYEVSSDLHGLGIVELLRGNTGFSLNTTSPIVLNLDIRDGWDYFSGFSHCFNPLSMMASPAQMLKLFWSQKERTSTFVQELLTLSPVTGSIGSPCGLDGHPGSGSSQTALMPSMLRNVQTCYRQAQSHFVAAGSASGVAAALLHEACSMETMLMLNNSLGIPEDPSDSLAMLRRSSSLFQASGDVVGSMLASTHIMLIGGGGGLGHQIGLWAKRTSNEVLGLHLALLVIRVALHNRFMKMRIVQCDSLMSRAEGLLEHAAPQSNIIFTVYAVRMECQAALGNYHQALILGGMFMEYFFWKFQHRFYQPGQFAQEMEINPLLFGPRIMAHQNALKRFCEITMLLIPHVFRRREFLKHAVGLLMHEVERYAELPFLNASTLAWINTQNRQMAFLDASLDLDKLRQENSLDQAIPLRIEDTVASLSQYSDPVAKLQLVRFLLDMERQEQAEAVLSAVTDLTPSLDDAPEGADSNQLFAQRMLESYEMLLDVCTRCKRWERAADAMNQIEHLSPGYFTTGEALSVVPVWTRFLWAARVMEGLDALEVAMRFLEQGRELYRISQHNRQASAMSGDRLVSLETGNTSFMNAYARVLFSLRDKGSYESGLWTLETCPVNRQRFPLFSTPLYFMSGDPGADALVAFEHSRTGVYNEAESWPAGIDEDQLKKDQYKQQLLEELALLGRDKTAEEEAEFEQLQEERKEFGRRLHEANLARDWTKMVWPHKDYIWKDILEAGRLAETLVVNVTVDESGLSLIGLSEEGVEFAGFNQEATFGQIRKQAQTCQRAFTGSNGRKPWQETGMEPLRVLSEWILRPLDDAIERSEHIVFILSGDLTQFPISTLLHRDGHLGLQKAISQVPSLYSLLVLAERSERPLKKEMIPFFSIGKPKPKDMASYALSSSSDRETPLPMAGIEAFVLASKFGMKPKDGAAITRDVLWIAMQMSDCVHLATHGYADDEAPLLSYISLAEPVRTIDFLAVPSDARLVIFSACLSGAGRATDRGSVLGFSHAVLAGGARAFMGALWSASDIATLVHMICFYGAILDNPDGLSIARLWQRATAMFVNLASESTNTAGIFQILLNTLETLEELGFESGNFVRSGKRRLLDWHKKAVKGELTIDWTHPFFWAPFTIMGDGRQVLTPIKEISPELTYYLSMLSLI